MWLKIYQISCIIALLFFAKMQYYGESFYSEDNNSARSSLHSYSGGSHHTYHK